jgi:hypothetical protein
VGDCFAALVWVVTVGIHGFFLSYTFFITAFLFYLVQACFCVTYTPCFFPSVDLHYSTIFLLTSVVASAVVLDYLRAMYFYSICMLSTYLNMTHYETESTGDAGAGTAILRPQVYNSA